jgi:hypothetical protein
MEQEYTIVNGTSYHVETPIEVVKWLETSRERGQRIRVFYGDNGYCWNDEHDNIGTVNRSTGTRKVPLLIHSARCYGGGAILDNKIVRIDTKDSKGKITIVYSDPSIRFDTFVSTDIGTVYNETKDELYGRCKNADAGQRLAAFMNGKRWTK